MKYALTISNLTKTYQNGVQALKGIDLNVTTGDFFALLGPNGAGKSTTIGILSSLVRKTSGEVKIFDADIDYDLTKAKSYLGIVPQEFNFSPFEKVIDIVVNQAGYYGIPRSKASLNAEKYLSKLHLWDKRNTQARALSGGMKRRLMIARALMHNPAMLILDEPTAGVDIEIRRIMWDFLQELNQQEGKTIILTTHYLEEAEKLCNNLAIINHGKIIKNSPIKDLISQLDQESYLFDLGSDYLLEQFNSNFHFTQIDPRTVEVTKTKEQSLNEIFSYFTQHNIPVLSMRNKVNRLEELFVTLTQQSEKQNEK